MRVQSLILAALVDAPAHLRAGRARVHQVAMDGGERRGGLRHDALRRLELPLSLGVLRHDELLQKTKETR